MCVDSGNNVVPGDPATCATHRNQQVGEATPYLLTDVDHNNGNVRYQARHSFPVNANNPYQLLMDFVSNQGQFDAGYQFNWDQSRDGYDLYDIYDGDYVSIVRTSDPQCWDQLFSGNGSTGNAAARTGGWILFPKSAPSSWPQTSSAITTTYDTQLSGRCASGNSQGVTYWGSPFSVTYDSGATLLSIRSFHFAAKNLSQAQNSMEKFYYTREYGQTRWEAWQTRSYCQQQRGASAALCHPENPGWPLAGRCSAADFTPSGNPGLDSFGNQDWVMVDCRDTSNYVSINTAQIFLDQVMAQNDGVVDVVH